MRRNRDLRFLGRCRRPNVERLFYSRILRRLPGERGNAVADRWIVVLSGSDRGFTKDRAARQSRTYLAEESTAAGPFSGEIWDACVWAEAILSLLIFI